MTKLTILGAGRMGGAMLAGALRSGWPGDRITVIEPNPTPGLRTLLAESGVALNPRDPTPAPGGILLLAIKPQLLDAARESLFSHAGAGTLILSILAGKRIRDLRARAPFGTKILRAMPNLPAAVGRGITGIFAADPLSAEEHSTAGRLLETAGKVVWLERESDIDALTAISGSGPAYVFHLVECLARAGEQLGLSPPLAMTLARATIEGAGELLYRTQETSASELRRNVTSPGGTTAAALEHLMGEAGLSPLIERAAAAAKARAEALSG